MDKFLRFAVAVLVVIACVAFSAAQVESVNCDSFYDCIILIKLNI